MNLDERISVLKVLGHVLKNFDVAEKERLIEQAHRFNPWFLPAFVEQAWDAWICLLEEQNLDQWASRYPGLMNYSGSKRVGLVLAGNLPAVGFHDILCVFLAGHRAHIKKSQQDYFLIDFLVDELFVIDSRVKEYIRFEEKMNACESIIATGSDNTSRYFEYYFKSIPHVIRKNRTSVAVLTGQESEQEKEALAKDVFSYFGRGCRNVTQFFIPFGYDLRTLFPYFESYNFVRHCSKYWNNYEYHKSVHLVNRQVHFDNGFALFLESDRLFSPVSCYQYAYYEDLEGLLTQLESRKEQIQVLVGQNLSSPSGLRCVGFGETQYPKPWDYADGVDTLDFLLSI